MTSCAGACAKYGWSSPFLRLTGSRVAASTEFDTRCHAQMVLTKIKSEYDALVENPNHHLDPELEALVSMFELLGWRDAYIGD